MTWDGTRPWTLHESVGLRPEPFGALAYHYGTRRLTFLKDVRLADVVRTLADHERGEEALRAAGVPDAQRPAFEAALERLSDAEVIRAR
ncbi:MAG TPA: mycofactocin biosynthesis chaperone MftB [Mycobacteriales bacterium]